MKYLEICRTTGISGSLSCLHYHKFKYRDATSCMAQCVTSFHLFLDASEDGYGICAYIRFVYASGTVKCSYLVGRSRSSSVRLISIPRL